MKTMKKLFVLTMAALAFVGCQKEKFSEGQLTLIAEGFHSNAKVTVSGGTSEWAEGDQVRINDQTATISIDGASATVSHPSGNFVAPFYGVYPAGIYSSNTGASYTLNLPASYTYAVSGGKQNIGSPMVAYASSGSKLLFKHVTAAIGVQVVNNFGIDVRVTNITVSSNKYKLNGSTTVALGESITVDAVTATGEGNAALRQVVMSFVGTPLEIASGGSATVQVPVLPVGNDNRFTISVTVQNKDDAEMEYTFSKTQAGGSGDGYILSRAQIGYAPAKFGGVFTVASGKQVRFSPGNLQYQASTGKWRFAQHQYDAIGNAAGNNVFDDTRSTQSEWIDLFGWATSGYNASAYATSHYQPYAYLGNSPSSTYGFGYGPNTKNGYVYSYTYSLIGDYAQCDWGVHNAISNGGNVAGQWRTLTGGDNAEWTYLMSTRDASTVSGVSNARYLKAKVNGVNGYIIFPDEFVLPDGVSITSSYINYSSSMAWTNVTTSISSVDWAKMEVAGAIFLPCTGGRSYSGSDPTFTANVGYYWSSIYYSASNAYLIQLGAASPSFAANAPRRMGCSVRLVRDVE